MRLRFAWNSSRKHLRPRTEKNYSRGWQEAQFSVDWHPNRRVFESLGTTMAQLKPGRVLNWRRLSNSLAIFRLVPEDGSRFPAFEAGQYIALRRDDCLLTRKIKEGNEIRFVPDLDEDGKQKRGPVTHSYSIASAPFETARDNYLEFYVVLERVTDEILGRFTGSLFSIETEGGDRLTYVERITGDFTLTKRPGDVEHVLMVGTGTGLAPFVSMIKQLNHESNGRAAGLRYTLIHTNRTYEELAYHEELLEIEASKNFDFVYLPSVSRPTDRDRNDPHLGIGRANNLLRHIFDIPPRESQAVEPLLPRDRPLSMLRERIDPSRTAVLACGNPDGMIDIDWVGQNVGMRFEKEEW
jgi:ferredoxin-NADP reductase